MKIKQGKRVNFNLDVYSVKISVPVLPLDPLIFLELYLFLKESWSAGGQLAEQLLIWD